METRKLTCIGCPMGCAVTVEIENGEVINVKGNTCKRGDTYAREEVANPTRIVTSSVKVEGADVTVVPVKTKEAIPKDKIFACMNALKKITVKPPVLIGDVIVADILGTGVDIVATKNVQ